MARSPRPRPTSTRLLVVHVVFEGPKDSKMIRMAVDTGATVTTIPPAVALAIGCDPARAKRRMANITASGIEHLPVVTVPRVVCLGRHVKSFPVVCHDLRLQSVVDGLLGLDFLAHLPVFRRFSQAILNLAEE